MWSAPTVRNFCFWLVSNTVARSRCAWPLDALREAIISSDLAADLSLMPKLQHLDIAGLSVMADLIVKSVFATLPDIIDPPAEALPEHLTPQAKITQQLRFIFIGPSIGKAWAAPSNPLQKSKFAQLGAPDIHAPTSSKSSQAETPPYASDRHFLHFPRLASPLL
jgi:hypothetical protein